MSRTTARHATTMTAIRMKAYTYIEKGRFEMVVQAVRKMISPLRAM